MIPLTFIDDLLPTLSDTEARLYLVIARQTIGWAEGKGRKEWDRLTHSELKRRTGRSSAPVSSAIASLQAKGLIRVRGKAGRLVDTPEARRAQYGFLTFALSPEHYAWFSESGFQKVKTTKQRELKETFINRKARNAAGHVNTGWQKVGNLIDVAHLSSTHSTEGGDV